MSNAVVYPKCLIAMWGTGAGAVAGTVKVVGVDSAYDATDEFLSDLASVVSDAVTVGGKAFNLDGTFTASPASLTGVSNVEHVAGIVTYVDTGVAGTSRLLTYTDTKFDTTSINVTGNGQIISVEWPNYVGRI